MRAWRAPLDRGGIGGCAAARIRGTGARVSDSGKAGFPVCPTPRSGTLFFPSFGRVARTAPTTVGSSAAFTSQLYTVMLGWTGWSQDPVGSWTERSGSAKTAMCFCCWHPLETANVNVSSFPRRAPSLRLWFVTITSNVGGKRNAWRPSAPAWRATRSRVADWAFFRHYQYEYRSGLDGCRSCKSRLVRRVSC